MLNGTTKIELTNVKTGEKEVYRHDNMVTNAINDILTLNPDSFKSVGAPSTTLFPVIPNLIGGIMLCENPLEENPAKYWVPADNPLVGYSNNVVNSGADPRRGSMNLTESGKLEDGTGYRFVFDFATSQGNGTISALGLTSPQAGACGKGSAYVSGNGIFKTHNKYSYAGSSSSPPTAQDVAEAVIMANVIAFDEKNSMAICAYLSAASTITVRKVKYGIDSIGLFDSPSIAMHSKSYEETTLTTTVFGSTAWPSYGNSNLYYTFLNGEDGYIWGFEHNGNTAGNSSGNATINWIKINIADSTFEEGTWTLAAQISTFGEHYYPRTSYYSDLKYATRRTHSIIHDGYLYCVNYAKTGIYKIELENPSNILYMAHPDGTVNTSITIASGSYYAYCGSVFNVAYDTVYFINGYIEDDEIIPTTYTRAYDITGCSPAGLVGVGKPNLRIGPFLFTFYYVYNTNSTSVYSGFTVYILGSYLATINNLETPVQKTADKTMKITYILREE